MNIIKKLSSYSIDHYSKDNLLDAGVPEAVISKLKAINGKKFESKGAFELALNEILSNDDKIYINKILKEGKVLSSNRANMYCSSVYNTYFPKSNIRLPFFTNLNLSRVVFPLEFRIRAWYYLLFSKAQEIKNDNLEGFDHNRKQLLGFLEGHRNRTERLINVLRTIQGYSLKNAKVLCVGPRNEAEVLLLRKYGFRNKNVHAIDLFSYSPAISVMDMNSLDFPDNYFDVYYSSAVIKYSPDILQTVRESLRVTKSGGLMAFGFTFGMVSDLVPDGSALYGGLKDLFKLYENNIEWIYWQEEFFYSEGDTRATAIFKIKK
jgi:SAM-dependent methyltransferase